MKRTSRRGLSPGGGAREVSLTGAHARPRSRSRGVEREWGHARRRSGSPPAVRSAARWARSPRPLRSGTISNPCATMAGFKPGPRTALEPVQQRCREVLLNDTPVERHAGSARPGRARAECRTSAHIGELGGRRLATAIRKQHDTPAGHSECRLATAIRKQDDTSPEAPPVCRVASALSSSCCQPMSTPEPWPPRVDREARPRRGLVAHRPQRLRRPAHLQRLRRPWGPAPRQGGLPAPRERVGA